MKKIIIVLIIIIAGVAVVFSYRNKKSNLDNSSGLVIGGNSIYAAEQISGQKVMVSVVHIEKPGYIVIHEDSDGNPGGIIGTSNLLTAGENEDIPQIDLSRSTADGETIYAMLHIDNGDGKFYAADDKPALDKISGEPVMMIVVVTKDASQPDAVNL